MPGSLNITGHSETEPLGETNTGPLSIIGKVVIGETLVSNLVMGDNRFTVPGNGEATACLIMPPVNVSAELKLRTNVNEADGGLLIGESNPTLLSFAKTVPTVLIVHSSAPTSSPISIRFI